MRSASVLCSVLAFMTLAVGAQAQPRSGDALTADPTPNSEAELLSEVTSAGPGDAFDVALRLTLDPGWHTYWENPGDTGQSVSIDWDDVPGVTIGPLAFPPPERIDTEGIISYAYHGEPAFPVRVSFADGVPKTVELAGTARWLVCADVCLPVESRVSTVIARGERAASPDQPTVAAARATVPSDVSTHQISARDVGEAADGSRTVELRIVADGGADSSPVVFPLLPSGARPVGDARLVEGSEASPPAWIVSIHTDVTDRFRGVLTWSDGASPTVIDVVVEGSARSALGFWGAFGFAFLGGLILNLMPCVFPILSIKVLGFVGGDRQAASLRRHGYAFGAGVLVSFWVFAGALLAFRAAGAGLGWGFQLQSPWLVAVLAGLFVALGLNLLGVFELGGALAGRAGGLDRRSGPGGAFLSGVLAVVVATPCTAPFMGAALAYALAQPPAASFAVFTALGIGMALPYVLLSIFPAWTDRLPRPGPWMTRLKAILALPLLATSAWLVWVFAQQLGADGALWLIGALIAVAVGAWAWGRPTSSIRRLAVPAVGVALILGTVAAQSEPATAAIDDMWAAYDADELAALRAEGRPVFVDVTAAWCLSCQVNERTALASDAVADAFEAADVALVKADWTSRDPEITAFLDRYGRAGVPLYVFFPASGEPVVLPEVLTPSIVVDAVCDCDAG